MALGHDFSCLTRKHASTRFGRKMQSHPWDKVWNATEGMPALVAELLVTEVKQICNVLRTRTKNLPSLPCERCIKSSLRALVPIYRHHYYLGSTESRPILRHYAPFSRVTKSNIKQRNTDWTARRTRTIRIYGTVRWIKKIRIIEGLCCGRALGLYSKVDRLAD